jgi:hypothetical protein
VYHQPFLAAVLLGPHDMTVAFADIAAQARIVVAQALHIQALAAPFAVEEGMHIQQEIAAVAMTRYVAQPHWDIRELLT